MRPFDRWSFIIRGDFGAMWRGQYNVSWASICQSCNLPCLEFFIFHVHVPCKAFQWIIVVLILFHLSHFLPKRNSSEKKLILAENWLRALVHANQARYQLSFSNIHTQGLRNYLYNIRISKASPQTLDHSCPCSMIWRFDFGMTNKFTPYLIFKSFQTQQLILHEWSERSELHEVKR